MFPWDQTRMANFINIIWPDNGQSKVIAYIQREK